MTLRQAYDNDNIFAKIIRGEMDCVRVYEDDETLVFMDIFPQSEGHALVIPKKAKATNILDIDPADLSALVQRVQKIAKAVEKALAPDGMRIIQFNGSEAGQTVFHIHFHVIPIYADAPLRPHSGGAPADSKKLNELAERIKQAL